MDIEEAIAFLGVDKLSVTFAPQGLGYLSLLGRRGEQLFDLREVFLEKGSRARQVVDETIRFLETGQHNMPLDFSSFTDFQQRVFAAIGQIPSGSVMTYKDVAVALGNPKAAQAVGSAAGRNPVAYFLPTHRVLPQRGLGICRSGAGHLREKLLEHEGHDLARLRGNYLCTRSKCNFW